ncbi:30_t:CDS:2, partial [Racocetra persica]
LDTKIKNNWLVNLNELAKNEETTEHEYHTSLNEDVRKEKMMYSSYLLDSRKSKHQIDRVEEITSTKRRKDLTNVSLEDDGRSNTTNIVYSGKSMDDRSILESADSKMNQVNNNLHSSSSVPSSNVNREEAKIQNWVEWQAKDARINWLEEMNMKQISELDRIKDINMMMYSELEQAKDEKREVEAEKRIIEEKKDLYLCAFLVDSWEL